jgi:hypothetical protein
MPYGELKKLCGFGAVYFSFEQAGDDPVPIDFLLGHGEERHG